MDVLVACGIIAACMIVGVPIAFSIGLGRSSTSSPPPSPS